MRGGDQLHPECRIGIGEQRIDVVPEKHPGYTHIALAVKDVAAMQATLADAGIALSGGPVTFESGSTSVFVRDPDRNVIEFTRDA